MFIVMIMIQLFEMINNLINSTIDYLGIYGPILGCFLILCESVLPILTLAVFVKLNCMTFGVFLGFIISWIFTCLGCAMAYKLFNKKVRFWFERKIKDKEKINKFMDRIENASVAKLAMIVAVPFTPSFIVNVASSLANMDFKKFITGICIGKLFMVYFWGFIGTNLIQSLTNPIILIRVGIMVIIAYLISTFVTKKFDL